MICSCHWEIFKMEWWKWRKSWKDVHREHGCTQLITQMIGQPLVYYSWAKIWKQNGLETHADVNKISISHFLCTAILFEPSLVIWQDNKGLPQPLWSLALKIWLKHARSKPLAVKAGAERVRSCQDLHLMPHVLLLTCRSQVCPVFSARVLI